MYGFTQPSNPHYMVTDDEPHVLAALLPGKESPSTTENGLGDP
jgi:hypothetical protein